MILPVIPQLTARPASLDNRADSLWDNVPPSRDKSASFPRYARSYLCFHPIYFIIQNRD